MDTGATGGKTGNSGNSSVTGPLLGSRRVRLEPVSAQHVPFLHALASNPLNGFRWQHGGNVPPLEVFEANLWHGVVYAVELFPEHSIHLSGWVLWELAVQRVQVCLEQSLLQLCVGPIHRSLPCLDLQQP